MLPLIPFIAGVAAGVFAANALRRGDVQDGIRRARRAMRDAADVSMQRVRRSSAQWRERWSRMDEGDADAADAEDIEMIDAAGDEQPDADAPRRRTRRGGRRRRREEPESGFDAEDAASDEGDAPAADADGEGSEHA